MSTEDVSKAEAPVEEPKKEEKESDDEMPGLENQASDKKMNRNEKKCRKALQKLGMKQLTGITRITLKKRDGMIFAINDPDVMLSSTSDNSYVVFGELKLDDANAGKMPNPGTIKMPNAAAAAADVTRAAPAGEQPSASAEEKKGDEARHEEEKPSEGAGEEGEESEEGITPMHIEMVMQHTNCTRPQAVKALKKNNNDMVNAIMELTK